MTNSGELAPPMYPLPPKQLRFMGEDDAKFMSIGDLNVRMLQQAMPVERIATLLDIGCGYGRLAHALLRSGRFSGVYYGLDILPQHVAWCQQALGINKNYYFKHLDIHNARYNPTGRHRVQDMDFSGMPRMDAVVLLSVLTHLYEEDIRFYLKSTAELLTPNGKIACTAFLLNAASTAGELSGKSRYPMPHQLNSHTRYFSEQDPLHAIGYDEAAIMDMFAQSGLRVEQVILGGWCGREVSGELDPFQDYIIASKA